MTATRPQQIFCSSFSDMSWKKSACALMRPNCPFWFKVMGLQCEEIEVGNVKFQEILDNLLLY
jgi:hypothetical protein